MPLERLRLHEKSLSDYRIYKKQGANLSGIDALETLTATRKELERLQAIQKAGGIVNPAQIALLEGQVKKTERELSGLDKQINDIMKNIQALSPSVKVNTENKKEEDALKKRLALLERIKKSTKDTSELVQLQEQIFDLQVRIAARDDKKRLTQGEFDDLIRGFQDQLNEAFLNQATSLEASPKVKFSPIIDKLDFNEIIKKSFTTKIAPIEFTDSTGIVFKPGSVSVDVTDMKDRVAKATNLEKITITLHDVRVRLLGSKKTRLIEGVEEINKQLSEDKRSSLAGLQGDLFSTFGESLGEAFTNAISGQDIGEGLKNAARQMLSILGSVMQQIGKYVIAAAIKIQLLKKTLETWAVKN